MCQFNIPGLALRIAYANARMAQKFNSENDEINWVAQEVRWMGVRACNHNESSGPPIMFQDEPALVQLWQDGFDFARACQYPGCTLEKAGEQPYKIAPLQ